MPPPGGAQGTGVGVTSGGDGGAGGGTTTGGGDDTSSSGVTATSTASVGSGGAGGGAGGAGTGGAGGAGGAGGTGGADGCSNGIEDGEETDVDCGGACEPCDDGLGCLEDLDCESGVCGDLFACLAPACDDGVRNGEEGDVDCGGPCITLCPVGATCNVGTDCESEACDPDTLLCTEPSCSDGVSNADETGIDCGGPTCPDSCPDGSACLLAEDCDSGVCAGLLCSAPTCTDSVRNGSESDVDCGGAECTDCGAGKLCGGNQDCTSSICTAGTCRCPSGMTTVPVPGGGSYCMDPTEVTYLEYQAFVTANPANTITGCGFNAGGYTPSQLWPPSASEGAANYQRRPVRHVDWCDAAMYCAYAGKRLCGGIDGGPSDAGELTTAASDQWFNACTSQGTNDYPYGDAFDTSACTESVGGNVTVPIAVRNTSNQPITSCQGGVAGVYQMSGNLAEWEDSCNATTGAADLCVVRGGSFADTESTALLCSSIETFRRDTTAADIGFRCCQ